jgi:hypothetical protein
MIVMGQGTEDDDGHDGDDDDEEEEEEEEEEDNGGSDDEDDDVDDAPTTRLEPLLMEVHWLAAGVTAITAFTRGMHSFHHHITCTTARKVQRRRRRRRMVMMMMMMMMMVVMMTLPTGQGDGLHVTAAVVGRVPAVLERGGGAAAGGIGSTLVTVPRLHHRSLSGRWVVQHSLLFPRHASELDDCPVSALP